MRTPEDIEADMAQLGRPRLTVWTMLEVRRSLAAARAWDEANPEKATRYTALVVELEDAQRTEAQKLRQLEADERMRRRLASKLETAGLKGRQAAAALSPRETQALVAARDWYASQKSWLLLCGGVGNGKTVAAGWCLLEAIRAGLSAEQRGAQQLARMSGFDEGAAELERLKHVDLLVVDDVGTEKASDWARALLFELLDARHEDGGRTILTSNLRPAALAAHLGERLADRIRGDASVLEVAGPSLRRGTQDSTGGAS